jgi:hypothetical protein
MTNIRDIHTQLFFSDISGLPPKLKSLEKDLLFLVLQPPFGSFKVWSDSSGNKAKIWNLEFTHQCQKLPFILAFLIIYSKFSNIIQIVFKVET